MKRIFAIIIIVIVVFSLCSCDLSSLIKSSSETESTTLDVSNFHESDSSESVSESAPEIEDSSSEESSSESASESESKEEVVTHTHSFASVVIEPACVEKGYTVHNCGCGYSYIDTFVDAIGAHLFERGVCTRCDEIDYPELINIISTETIKANVSVKTQYSNKGFGFMEQIVGISNGSGVIIKHVDSEYYVLTNNHVIYSKKLEDSTSYTSYFIIDYIGTEYKADCIANMPEYDLALMKFTSTETYTVLELEAGNSEEGDLVVSLGQPEGQSNTITLGNVNGYGKVNLKDSDPTESNVTFDVLHHDAYINSGSSGGALLDAELNIIGINYAGAINDLGENFASYAIPVEDVYRFFDEVGFEYNEAPNTDDSVDEEQSEEQTETQAETEEVA